MSNDLIVPGDTALRLSDKVHPQDYLSVGPEFRTNKMCLLSHQINAPAFYNSTGKIFVIYVCA